MNFLSVFALNSTMVAFFLSTHGVLMWACIAGEKERKLLKQQQEFEEYKKEEMLSVHKQRQADIDAVKEENDKLRTQVLLHNRTVDNYIIRQLHNTTVLHNRKLLHRTVNRMDSRTKVMKFLLLGKNNHRKINRTHELSSNL